MLHERIKHAYRVLRELHGNKISYGEILITLSDELDESVGIIDEELCQIVQDQSWKVSKSYGMVIGRFQPFHHGHQHIINEVLLDGRVPIVFLGNDSGKDIIRNPWSFEQRKELIKLVYPNVDIIFVDLLDNTNWTKWFNTIKGSISIYNDITLYYNNKPQDIYDYFTACGRDYYNEYYTKIFEDNSIKTKQIEFVERTDIKIDADATNIRDDIEKYKHLLDARVYFKLKLMKVTL